MTLPSFTTALANVWPDGSDVDKADIRTHLGEAEAALNALFGGAALINGILAVSVASNSLTIAVKTAAGADPSATDPVYCLFRDATLTDGGIAILTISAATSLTVSAGAELGTVNDTAFDLLVVAFNDGGTFRLGVYQPQDGATFVPLPITGVASATAEGGDGSADSAGVFYAGAAVSSKAVRLIGRLTWSSGLPAVGLWSAVPTVVRLLYDVPEAINFSPAGLALGQGVRGADIFKALAADATGADAATAQPWFPTNGGASVAADTTYFFEGVLRLSRAAGTTAHTTGILFGGTATLTDIDWMGEGKTGDTNALAGISGFWAPSAAELVLKASSTSATEQALFRVKGVVRINAAGTLIPQFKYSAAPGGAPTILRGTWFRLIPVGPGDVIEAGTWS